LGNLCHFLFFTCFVLEIPKIPIFAKKKIAKGRPIKKYVMYEAKTLQKVVKSNKPNLQKVSGIYVNRVQFCGKKTAGGIRKKRRKRSLTQKTQPFFSNILRP
jgi:hypothetical protein